MSTWIVRITAVVALGLATPFVASAQATGTITGTVVDAESGQPLAGAQVHLPSTQQGVLSNPQGRFILLNAPSGQQAVRVQILGYATANQTVTVPAGGTVTADFRLSQQAIDVEGVVVTALGIERSERSLGYAVQEIGQQQMQEAPKVNITDALQGRVAGVSVTPTSSRPGSGSRIVIRGESSFTGGGQPLYVIDGVPISMDTDDQSGSDMEVGQAGSRSMDIDMNNVESISVLRGAAATALYGSRAAQGAIIIQTKQGQPGAPTRFAVNTRYEVQQARLEGFQEQFTAGRDGFYCNGLGDGVGGWCESGYYDAGNKTPTTNRSWGPRYDQVSAEVMAHECPGVSDPANCIYMSDPRKDFYKDGALAETSINATGGLPNGGSFNLGASYLNHDGIQPSTTLERLNLNANISLQLTDRLLSTSTVMYSNAENVWLTEGWQGTERTLMYLTPNLDVRKAWNDDGTPVMWGSNSPHPAWVAANEERTGSTGRWIASQYFKFDILDNLSLSNRLGFDTYLDTRIYNQNERPWQSAEGRNSGSTRQERYTRSQLNNDLVLSLSGTELTDDVTVSGLAGFNVLQRENDNIVGRGSDIIIPELYNIYNFLDQRVDADLTEKSRIMGLYSQVTADYKDWAFLTLTARNDWSSTLPLENNSYFYPSASLGVVFTDALGIRNDWLDYGKIRLSVAKVGSDAPPYRLASTYRSPGMVEWPFNGTQGFLQGTRLGNPNLKPESTTEYELGTELRMLQGRARLDVSYYDKRSYDQIFSVPSTPTTGFDEITRNAGDLRNEGLEATLQVVPVQTPKMRWDVNMNWTKNKSTVLELAPGVVSIHLAGYNVPNISIRSGEPYGVIYGHGYERTDDGTIVIDDDPDSRTYGWPLMDDDLVVMGNTQPDWEGNVYSSFRYGPFTLSGLVSTLQGGDVFDFTLNYTISRGATVHSLDRGTEFVYPGVKASNGQANDITIARDENYFSDELGGYLRDENYVESATNTRLQELSLMYQLPARMLDVIGVSSASIYATGHNLKVWSNYTWGDPMVSQFGDTNAGGRFYHMFPAPPMRSFSFGLRANF